MSHLTRFAAVVALLLFAACSVEISLDGAADADLIAAAGDEYLDFVAARDPYLKFRRGEKVEDFPDWTLEAAEADASFAKDLLGRLDGVDEEAVDHEDWISLRLLRWNLGMLVEAPKHYWADFNITPYAAGGFSLNILHQVLGAAPVGTDEDRAHYFHLLDEYAQGIGQLADKVAGQKERGIYLPKAQVPAVVGMFEGYRGRLDELFVPAADRAGDGSDDFLNQVREAVETGIDAQFVRLVAELGDDYLEAAPEQVGLSEVPGGRELYVHRVRSNTTTDLTPEEIHQLGLEQVAQIEAELAALREEIGFEATSQETAMREFLDQVRADPRFIAASPEEVEERYMGYIEKIEPHIADYFDVLPEAPYGVRRLDPTSEATMTFGVYQLPTSVNPRGEYRYNGSDLENRSLFSAQGLIYHELIPGHHFQLALANEREDLPRFRRETIGYGAFTEGWAEYAANLGKEMGVYENAYDLYGRLVMEMFISCRLVLDTGMNHFGWDLERAREYMSARVVYSDVEVATELLRYSADIHGQALAYRIGNLEILRLRRKAEEALGDRFDIKAFHAAVIGSGAMPMVVLEEHIDWWIEQQG
ncbi:MAG: DUF885 domain-containing protein [Holophagales bacterium]|nr:DUF885 domain-containing protein [Holophagales bacterium]